MRLGIRIWCIAELLNALLCLCSLVPADGTRFETMSIAATISIPFALMGGLPAIPFFMAWLYYLQKLDKPRRQTFIMCLILLPMSMASLSFGLLFLLHDTNNDLLLCAILPVVATALSVLLHRKRIALITQQENYNERYIAEEEQE